MRSPASMSAVTISPRPWSQPCSVGAVTSAVGSAYEPLTVEAQRLGVLPVGVAEAQLARRDALVLERRSRPGGSR